MSNTLEGKKAFYKSHLASLAKLLETCKTSAERKAVMERMQEVGMQLQAVLSQQTTDEELKLLEKVMKA